MRVAKLSDKEINNNLERLEMWTFDSNSISRDYEFSDFEQSMIFVNRVAKEAESANHHPDIDIRYSKVNIRLSTHDSGGVTTLDFQMAKACDAIAITLLHRSDLPS